MCAIHEFLSWDKLIHNVSPYGLDVLFALDIPLHSDIDASFIYIYSLFYDHSFC